MSKYTLKRRYFEGGTYSTLEHKGDVVCYTVERPWLNNKKSESCVPEGEYKLIPHNSPRFGYCYAIECESLGVGVTKGLRTHILIHKANTPDELEGCIAPGKAFGYVNRQWAVVDSTSAFNDLIQELAGEEHTLIIERS